MAERNRKAEDKRLKFLSDFRLELIRDFLSISAISRSTWQRPLRAEEMSKTKDAIPQLFLKLG